MTEGESTQRNIEFKEGETTIVYCQTCKTYLYRGNPNNQIKSIVFRTRVADHAEWYYGEHEIEVHINGNGNLNGVLNFTEAYLSLNFITRPRGAN